MLGHLEENARLGMGYVVSTLDVIQAGGRPPLAELEQAAREQFDFHPVTAKAEILGFCRQCRERKRAEIIAQASAQKEEQAI